ncbi:MAG: folate family ECF transporter S component [Clostridia bacterium]|nr:folate family ECF transporter S component [Clostridia bacterium]
MMRKMQATRGIVYAALLVALEIILTRFVQIPILLDGFTNRINPGLLPVAAGGMLFGPLGGGLIAAVADLIRAILFPQGAFNPLFTITATLRGVVFGAFLWKKTSYLRIILASLVNVIFVNIVLNTLFISFSYGGSFWVRVLTSLPITAINFVLQTALLVLVLPPIERSLTPHA